MTSKMRALYGRRPSRTKRARAEAILPLVNERLAGSYGTKSLGNLPDPLDELVFIQLSLRTREEAYSTIYDDLRTCVNGNWANLLTAPEPELLAVLERGGMARVKLERLRKQVQQIQVEFGSADLSALKQMSDCEAEDFLTSLPGVGPKAARCVLLYSLGRNAFPVDSHCLRINIRLGLISSQIDRKAAHDYVQELIPPHLRYSLHVNMVHHGRSLCLPRTPACDECPLIDICPTGAARLAKAVTAKPAA